MKRVQTASLVMRLTAAGTMAAMLGGVASADSITYSDTGSGSSQQTTVNNTYDSDISNTNNVVIVNANNQTAGTGNVQADGNTSVEGGVESGNAGNNNLTTNTVSIDNPGAGGMGGGTGVGNSNGGSGSGNVGGMGGGSALGASTGSMGAGVATLPEVGASSPKDLSALRSLYRAASGGNAAVAGTDGLNLGLLVPAFLLSALAGIGTMVRQKRRQITEA